MTNTPAIDETRLQFRVLFQKGRTIWIVKEARLRQKPQTQAFPRLLAVAGLWLRSLTSIQEIPVPFGRDQDLARRAITHDHLRETRIAFLDHGRHRGLRPTSLQPRMHRLEPCQMRMPPNHGNLHSLPIPTSAH